jgi:hypothetical protein
VLIVIGMMICYLQKDSLPVIINLTSTSSEIMQALLIVIIILLSIYVIPINYFIISVILILLSIFVVPVFAQKSLVISSKGIRYVCKWNLKWLDINTYNLDKENGILNIQVKNGENKQIRGIKRKHYSIIETSIDNYLNSIAIV